MKRLSIGAKMGQSAHQSMPFNAKRRDLLLNKKALQPLLFGALGLFSLIPEHNRRVIVSFRSIVALNERQSPAKSD